MQHHTPSNPEILVSARMLVDYIDAFGDFRGGQNILDVASGLSSFHREAEMLGLNVTAVDPAYARPPEALLNDYRRAIETLPKRWCHAPDTFMDIHPDVLRERLLQEESQAIVTAANLPVRLRTGQAIIAALPNLPFVDHQFDVALCSHFLFLYDRIFNLDFHIAAIEEMIRVAKTVMIFPLISLSTGLTSPLVSEITRYFGDRCAIEPAKNAFRRHANTRLVITR